MEENFSLETPKKSNKVNIIIAIVIVVIISFFVLKYKKTEIEVVAEKEVIKTVKTVDSEEYLKLNGYVLTTGEVKSVSSLDIKAEIGGKVKGVYVSVGDKVYNDHVLVELDSELLGIQKKTSTIFSG